MRKGIPDDLRYYLSIGGRVFLALEGPSIVGYIRAYDRSAARSIAKKNGVQLGRQAKQYDIVGLVKMGKPEIGGSVPVDKVVPDALRGWRVVEDDRNEYTGQRSVKVYDDKGELRSMRSGTRLTDAEILADAARDVGVTSPVRRFVHHKNPGRRVRRNPGATERQTLTIPTCAACGARHWPGTPHPRTRRNPPLTMLGNPGRRRAASRGRTLSRHAISIRYQHATDNKLYEHKFGRGVCIELLADGSFRLYGMKGQRLWKDFR